MELSNLHESKQHYSDVLLKNFENLFYFTILTPPLGSCPPFTTPATLLHLVLLLLFLCLFLLFLLLQKLLLIYQMIMERYG